MASSKSPIEWTDASWNPVRGCSRVSEGCRHCYAERLAYRFSGEGKPYEGLVRLGNQGPVWTGEIKLVRKALDEPFGWRKPQRVFVNSMSDLFHEKVPDGFIMDVWRVMAACPHLTFQIVTKRPERAAAWLARWADTADEDRESKLARGPAEIRAKHRAGRALLWAEMLDGWGEPPPGCAFPTYDWMQGPRWWPTVLPNVWLLTSVENQDTADERIPHLLRCPAAVRGASYEPALGPVDFSRWLLRPGDIRTAFACDECGAGSVAVDEDGCCATCGADARSVPGLDWIIAGGESGPGARPPHPKWFQDARDQVKAAAGAAFFFKQYGVWAPRMPGDEHGPFNSLNGQRDILVGIDGLTWCSRETAGPQAVPMSRVGKRVAGRLLDGVEHNGFPVVGTAR